jgi:hypothetical protein
LQIFNPTGQTTLFEESDLFLAWFSVSQYDF